MAKKLWVMRAVIGAVTGAVIVARERGAVAGAGAARTATVRGTQPCHACRSLSGLLPLRPRRISAWRAHHSASTPAYNGSSARLTASKTLRSSGTYICVGVEGCVCVREGGE